MREVHIFPHIPENLAFAADNLKYAKSGSWVIRDRLADSPQRPEPQYVNFQETLHMLG